MLSLGHMVNDSYSNVIPPLLPLLQTAYNLTYTLSGVIMTVYTITSSVIQPVFGYIADRHGRRWLIALSVLWIAFFMSMIGIVGYLGLDANELLRRHPRPGGHGRFRLLRLPPAGLGHGAPHQRHPQRRRRLDLLRGRQPRLRDHAAAGRAYHTDVGAGRHSWCCSSRAYSWHCSCSGTRRKLRRRRSATPGLKELWADIMAVIRPLSVVNGDRLHPGMALLRPDHLPAAIPDRAGRDPRDGEPAPVSHVAVRRDRDAAWRLGFRPLWAQVRHRRCRWC